MEKYYLVHNPRCSKSRETLSLLETHGIKPEIIDYLQGDLSQDLLEKIFKALNKEPKDVLRMKEEEFLGLNLNLENPQEVIEAILRHPKILERPILMKGNQAVIGRPPEAILSLIKT